MHERRERERRAKRKGEEGRNLMCSFLFFCLLSLLFPVSAFRVFIFVHQRKKERERKGEEKVKRVKKLMFFSLLSFVIPSTSLVLVFFCSYFLPFFLYFLPLPYLMNWRREQT